MNLGKNIKYLRNKNSITQLTLGEILAVSQTTIGDYENGKTEPNISRVIKIADYFSVSIDALLLHDMAAVGIVNEPPAKYNNGQQDTELKSALQRVKDLEQTIAAKDALISLLMAAPK